MGLGSVLIGIAVGALIRAILKDQFERTRDGDRFWYEIDPGLSKEEVITIGNTKLYDVILRNTSITSGQLPSNKGVFHVD